MLFMSPLSSFNVMADWCMTYHTLGTAVNPNTLNVGKIILTSSFCLAQSNSNDFRFSPQEVHVKVLGC